MVKNLASVLPVNMFSSTCAAAAEKTNSNITMAPTRPEKFDLAETRVSICYIFAIAIAGPNLFVITFIIWRLFWHDIYGPIQALTHKYFYHIIKPTIAIGQMQQDISVFASFFVIPTGGLITLCRTRKRITTDAKSIEKR